MSSIKPLVLGHLRVDPPVVLAPMAGITNHPFRALCRSFGAGLYVSEMVHAATLVAGRRRSADQARFGPGEAPRSIQLYGVDTGPLADATRLLVEESAVDHIDLNFGCPVRKVTAAGGGAAIPVKPRLLARLVRAVIGAAGSVPVTIKVRMGIDDALLTYREAGRIAQDEGCAAIGLHARTAAQLYSGKARWEAIADLKSRVALPVLGNGDIFVAEDAVRMIEATGCDGVIVGRGCLGRPWLFGELAALLRGDSAPAAPPLGQVCDIIRAHADALCQWQGEDTALRQMRKHLRWYLMGYHVEPAVLNALVRIETLEDLEQRLHALDPCAEVDPAALELPRAKGPGTQRVRLPTGYLDDRDDDRSPTDPAASAPLEGG